MDVAVWGPLPTPLGIRPCELASLRGRNMVVYQVLEGPPESVERRGGGSIC